MIVRSSIDIEKEVKAVEARLLDCEEAILSKTIENLKARCSGSWAFSDDDIFEAHTAYVSAAAIEYGLPFRPVLLWELGIKPAVAKAEAEMGLGRRVHKGAPLYNSFLCLLLAGDIDRAFEYLHSASNENFLLGRSPQFALALGDDDFSRQTVIRPIYLEPILRWSPEILLITGINASEDNVLELLRWLGSRPTDAIQALLTLHRLRRLRDFNSDCYAQHLRMRCLGDLLLIFESSLRRWQIGVSGDLYDRARALLAPNVVARDAFTAFHDRRNQIVPSARRSTPQAVDWLVSDAFVRLSAAKSNAERCGIAIYLGYGLRNSLMHVMEDQINLYSNPSDLMRCAGVAFTLLQVSKIGSEGKIAAL